MSVKVIGGTMVGVFVPIAVEYAMNGADISTSIPLKWSGVAGIVIGAVPLGMVLAKIGPFSYMQPQTKDAVIAFGAASLATGLAILLLEQLRNSTAYKFQARGNARYPMQVPMVPMNPLPSYQQGLAQQYTAPVGQAIKEI
jgi:hypothetical protein